MGGHTYGGDSVGKVAAIFVVFSTLRPHFADMTNEYESWLDPSSGVMKAMIELD